MVDFLRDSGTAQVLLIARSTKSDVKRREASRNSVANVIWAYLEEQPEAADTLEGVVEWWVPQQRLKMAAEEIEAALRELTQQGFVLAEIAGDGRVHYRMHPDKKQQLHRQKQRTGNG